MAGFPQLREAGWLYGPDDPWLPLAQLRLFEHRDTGRWEIRANDPASGPTQTVEYPDEAAARAELGRLYEGARVDGEWRVRQVEPY